MTSDDAHRQRESAMKVLKTVENSKITDFLH